MTPGAIDGIPAKASSASDPSVNVGGGSDGYVRLASGVIVPASAAQGRTDLGLGTAATQASSAFAAASHSHAESDVTNLTTDLAAKLVKASNLSDLASASSARANLGLTYVTYPDVFSANELFGRVADTGAGVTATLSPVLYPIEPKGRRTFALDSLMCRVATLLSASTWGAAVYSVVWASGTFTATLVAVVSAAASGAGTGVIKQAVTGTPVTLDFTANIYYVAHMASSTATLAFNGATSRNAMGAVKYTGAARSSATDFPATIDNNAGGQNNGGAVSSVLTPWIQLANAAGGSYL